MTVRQKISLLITAAGFLASLVFSCIIVWEMREQPFRIMDADLQTTAERAVHLLFGADTGSALDVPLLIDDRQYWLKVYDQESGRLLYTSSLAKQIEIPEPAPESSATVSLIVPRGKIDVGQDSQSEATFRMNTFRESYNGKTFLVCAGRPMEQLEEELTDIFIGVGAGLAVSVLLLLVTSYFVAGLILKPIRAMNDQARDISEKHLDRRIPVSSERDEFNTLARTLNQVFDRLQHAFLQQKRLLADASHELKTPLTMIRLSVDELQSAWDGDPGALHREGLTRMTGQVLRMERLVKNLLDLSSLEIEESTAKEPVDISGVLDSLVADYRFLADTRTIQIDVRLAQQLPVQGNREKLIRAFSNILDNAIKYNVDGGRVEVIADHSGRDITITVSNTGPGVAEEEIPKVFDQFYRVEESRSVRYGGSGLGLAIVKRIIDLHGGSVRFESRQGDWTRVTVSLPIRRPFCQGPIPA